MCLLCDMLFGRRRGNQNSKSVFSFPKSLTFSPGFEEIIRKSVPLTGFGNVPHEVLQSLSTTFGVYLSYISLIQDCHIRVFSGRQPKFADEEDDGLQCLVELEKTSQEVLIENGSMIIRVTMKGEANNSGLASWARINRKCNGHIETPIWLDGSVGTSPSTDFLTMPNNYVVKNSEVSIELKVSLPDIYSIKEDKL